MEAIIKFNSDLRDVPVEDLGQGFGIVNADTDELYSLYSLPGVENVELPKNVFLNIRSALTASCITSIQSDETLGLSGKGVIVGIIDTGVDYTHPEFRFPDGSTRILSIWDQRTEGVPPDGFNIGTEYTSAQINSALVSNDPFSVLPQQDIGGHGTAVAGIAAGNSGAAPGSSIIAVRVGRAGDDYARSTSLMRALRYVINKAREYNMPAAINLSFGMNEGSHNGDSLFEEYITAVSSEWKTSVVIPTGNEGGAGHHYSGSIKTGETLDIEFFTSSGISGLYLSMWKNYADDISAELFLPDGSATGTVYQATPPVLYRFGDTSVGIIYGQPTVYSTSQEVYFDIRSERGFVPTGAWRLRLRGLDIANGSFDIWLPTVEQVTTGTYFAVPDNFNTLTIPSTSQKVIRTSGYNYRIGNIAEFSGKGTPYTNFPDTAAPAVNITAPAVGGGFDTFTGTSFAAPFVTGSAALLMEWGIVMGNSPFLYGERLKAYIRKSARRSSGIKYPDPSFGYGKLCAAGVPPGSMFLQRSF